MKQKLLEREYNNDNLIKQIQKVDLTEQKKLWQNNEKISNIQQNASRHVRSCKKKLAHSTNQSGILYVFVNKSTIAFKRNKNIQDLLGGHLIKNRKVVKKN